MSLERLLETVRGFEGVLELAPEAGGPFPEIAWPCLSVLGRRERGADA